MEEYIIILLRIIFIMFILLFSALFIMGKRPIGELPVFDFLAIIVMGSIVGADIADPKIEHLPTAFAVIILALFQRIVSTLIIKNKKINRLLTFEPTIVIKDGKLLYKNIKKITYSIDDILMMLREKEVFDISRIKYGIIEPSGNISILKKPEYETVTLRDMNIPSPLSNESLTIILEGEFQKENIERLNTTEEDILEKLKAQGFNSYKEVFYGSMDFQGNIAISPYKARD